METVRHPENMKMTLKTARELSGLTQSDAAQQIGVNVDTLGNYERGKYYPDIPTLRKIERAYGVKYDQLIFFVRRKYTLLSHVTSAPLCRTTRC